MSHEPVAGNRPAERRLPNRVPMRRRGKVTGAPITVRLQPELLAKVDQICAGTTWSRPEAIRLILKAALERAV